MRLRVEEDGKSEGRPVMGRIGVEPQGNITPRESGQTSIGSLITRKVGQLPSSGKADDGRLRLAGAPARQETEVAAPSEYRESNSFCYCVPNGAFERLEPCLGKLGRTVLRGLRASNGPRLPGS
jgi:hypothetical protein